jgi:serine phosphatase RsbU (regulator of sigma subunit)
MSLIDQTRQFWKSATGLPDDLAASRQSARETSMCGHVVASNEALVVDDVKKDRRFANNPFLKKMGIRFYAGAPLTTRNGHAIGSVCVIDNKPRKISAREVALLRLVADGVMKEVELRKLSREAAIIVERLEKWDHTRRRELDLARAVQHFLLPPEQYHGATFLLCHSYQPRPDGGRTLTHVEVGSDGAAALLLADVCGEGASAALMAILLKSVFSRAVQTQMDPGAALTALNAELGKVAHADDRITAVVSMFDPLHRKLRMASAGHPAPILLRDDEARALELRGDPPLIVDPEHRYEQVAVNLEVADRLLLYTDGAVDVMNNAESFLGLAGLSELVRTCRHHHGKDFLQSLFTAIQGFTEHDLEDDVALLVLECMEEQTLPLVASGAHAATEEPAASDIAGT